MKAIIALLSAAVLLVSACGDDSSDGGSSPVESTDLGEVESGDEAAAGGGGGGALVFSDETISFESARCFLEAQDAAAGGGKILFVAQAFGTNEAGDPVAVDVSRYDEDSMFTGDEIIIDIGDPSSDDAVSWTASTDLGTVAVSGSSVSAGGVTLVDTGSMTNAELTSLEINC